METVGLIPVFQRDSEVAAWAIVDEATFAWLKQWRWALDTQGYPGFSKRIPGPLNKRNSRKQVRVLMHRHLMRLGYGDKRVVDHINGDKLDNRLANLRILTRAENGQNKPSYRGSTSNYRGVHWYPPKEQWRVAIMVNGVRTLVGYFDDEDEAGAAAEVFYQANVPYHRQESATAEPRAIATARSRADNSGRVEAHLTTVNV